MVNSALEGGSTRLISTPALIYELTRRNSDFAMKLKEGIPYRRANWELKADSDEYVMPLYNFENGILSV